jgi:hypothetical protein
VKPIQISSPPLHLCDSDYVDRCGNEWFCASDLDRLFGAFELPDFFILHATNIAPKRAHRVAWIQEIGSAEVAWAYSEPGLGHQHTLYDEAATAISAELPPRYQATDTGVRARRLRLYLTVEEVESDL